MQQAEASILPSITSYFFPEAQAQISCEPRSTAQAEENKLKAEQREPKMSERVRDQWAAQVE